MHDHTNVEISVQDTAVNGNHGVAHKHRNNWYDDQHDADKYKCRANDHDKDARPCEDVYT